MNSENGADRRHEASHGSRLALTAGTLVIAVVVVVLAALIGREASQPSSSPSPAARPVGAVTPSPPPSSTSTAAASPAATPPSTPTPSPAPDLVGRLRGTSLGCAVLRDAQGEAWEIAWPSGYTLELSDGEELPQLIGPRGEVMARFGDWIGLRGSTPSGVGSRCMVGTAFEASEVAFVETRHPPADGALPSVLPLLERIEVLGDRPFYFADMHSIDLGRPDFVRWQALDRDTLALNRLEGGSLSAWIAELDSGRLRRLPVDGRLSAVDAIGRLLLLVEPSASGTILRLADREGAVTAELATDAADVRAVVLDDGSVVYADGQFITRWQPTTGEVTRWEMPVDTDVTHLFAVGAHVIAAGYEGAAFIFDPVGSAQIGPSWRPDDPSTTAAAPDGRRFVTTVDSAHPRGRLQIRDATTGEVLASNRGRVLSTVTEVAWPTTDVILVMRAPTGTDVTADPELYRASDFASPPARIDALVDDHEQLQATGGLLAAVSRYGEVVLATADEGEPPAASLRASEASPLIGRQGSWCYRSACADAGPHPARILPRLMVDENSRLEVYLTPPYRFVRWTVSYLDAADEEGPPTVLSEGGDYNPDPDEGGPTLLPLAEYKLVALDAPPAGDWIVGFDVSFPGEGDAVYYWRVTVD